MDRRSWLWRRKSSEKTPGESESSGSISSPSDRFSDEQVSSGHSKQSPEITSKVTPSDEPTEKVRILTEKLSAAQLNISAKEELVKQHARVADEAVTGWEKAEREVTGLKLQLDAALKKNSALEDRVGHLDGALKECVRQLRQAREEQERKLEEVIAKRTHEWESRKSELESQLTKLSSKLEAAKSEAAASIDALSQKLKVRTLERDYSTKTAESASKQRLESIKKVAKLEAECRRLKALARKSSADVDSVSDCRSDYTAWSQTLEADVHKINECEPSRPGLQASSSDNILLDDFLEMERLAAFSEKGNRTLSPEARASSKTNDRGENALKAELEAMINRTAVLEDKMKKLEAEKGGLEMALSESQAQLEASRRQLGDIKERSIELESHLSECQAQLQASGGQLKATKSELKRVQSQLIECRDELRMSQAKLNAAENELIELQTKLIERDDQLSASEGRLRDALAKSKDLQDQLQSSQGQLKVAESELVNLRTQLHECENQLTISQEHVKDTEARLMEMQTQLSESQGKLTASEGQIKDANNMLADLQAQLALTCKLKQDVEGDLEASNAKREGAELRAKAFESEISSLLAKFNSLVDEADKERALSAEAMAKCQRLEDELSKRDLKPYFDHPASFKDVKKAVQEKELAMAVGKLADCQKTIASLGRQLKSLATLDDFLVDSDSPSEFSKEPSVFETSELGKVPCIDCQ